VLPLDDADEGEVGRQRPGGVGDDGGPHVVEAARRRQAGREGGERRGAGLGPIGGAGPFEARGAQVGRGLQRGRLTGVEALRRRPRERHDAERHPVRPDERQAGEGLEARLLHAVDDARVAGADRVEVAEQHDVVAPEGVEHRPRTVEPAHVEPRVVDAEALVDHAEGAPVVGE
jgi:hypothetical protein